MARACNTSKHARGCAPRRGAGAALGSFVALAAVVAVGLTTTAGRPGTHAQAGAPSGKAAASSGAISVFPVRGTCTFTDTYGAPRSGGRVHQGVDIIAPIGRPVYAAVGGTLTKQTTDYAGSLSGNAWHLTMPDGTYYFYAHMSAFAAGLSVGSQVQAGQVIGYVGETGNAGVPHLHFEVHPGGGDPINPTPIVATLDSCASPNPPPGASPDAGTPATPSTTTTTLPRDVATASGTIDRVLNRWEFIEPLPVLDTTAGAKLTAGATRTVAVAVEGSIPATTRGVLARITVTGATGIGHVAVHTCRTSAPTTSTLNVASGVPASSTTFVTVLDGEICVTPSLPVHVQLDVIAFSAAAGAGVDPVPAWRAVDTRQTPGGALPPGASLALTATQLGVDPAAVAVGSTITIVSPAGAGVLSIGPCGGSAWTVPYSTRVLTSVATVSALSVSGLCFSSTTAVHLIVDVHSVWGGAANPIEAAQPTRLFDSRLSAQTGGGVVGTAPVAIQVATAAGVPAGARRVALNVTLIGGTSNVSAFVWTCGQAQPAAATLAAGTNELATATTVVTLSAGQVCIATDFGAHVILDVIASG